MGTIFHDWCNANELRNYPLADLASKRSETGVLLPDNFLVDANIWIPSSAGTRVALSSAAITPGLVTLTFVADGGGTPVPVAALAIPKPVTLYRKYNLSPYYPGVGGWVSFGAAVEQLESLSLLFNTFTATELVPKIVRSYDDLPLLSVGKKDRVQALTGLVEIRGGDDIEVLACTDDWPVGSDPNYIDNPRYKRKIDGEPRRCIAIRLAGDPQNYETLYAYTGPCAKAPESQQCGRRLVQRINGVSPDCNGNIEVEFRHIPVGTVMDSQDKVVGLSLDYQLGLTDVCDPTRGLSLPDPVDLCYSSSSSSAAGSVSAISMSMSSTSLFSMSSACPSIVGPAIETFTGTLHCWDRPSGDWSISDCQLLGTSDAGWGVSLWELTPTLGHDIQSFIQLLPGGVETRAYFIFGYESPLRFWFVELDAVLGRVIIGRRNGPQIVEESLPVSVALPVGEYIHLRVTVSLLGQIQTWINGSAGPQVTAVAGTLLDGPVGFGTRMSHAKFDNLAFDWWTTDPDLFPGFDCSAPELSSVSISSAAGTQLLFDDGYLDLKAGELLAAWKMEEAAGTRYDMLGNFPMAPFNSVSRITGKDGFATSYAGVPTRSYMRHADEVLIGRPKFTASMWVYFDTLTPSGPTQEWVVMLEANVLHYIPGNFNTVSPSFILSVVSTEAGQGQLNMLASTDDPAYPYAAHIWSAVGNYGDVAVGWNHIMVHWDSDAESAVVLVNGAVKLTAGTSKVAPLMQTALRASESLVRHALYLGGAGAAYEVLPATMYMTNSFLQGRMDETYLWSDVFTDAEEAADRLYNAGAGRYLRWTYPPASSSILSSSSSSAIVSVSSSSLSSAVLP